MASLQKNLDHWCERGILFLLLGMMIFAPLAFGAVEEWSVLVIQGISIAIFILWLVRLWLNPKPKLLWPPLAWVVVAFTIYAVGRYFTADIEYVARAEVIQVLLFAFVFFVVVNNLHGQSESQVISFTLIALGTAISGYAVFQMVTHSERVWNVYSGYVGRAGGTYVSPNAFAGLLELLLPLALGYLLAGRVSIVTRILLGYAVLAMGGGLAATFSRAGWVSCGVGCLFVLLVLVCHRNHRWRALLCLVVLLAGGGLFVGKYLSKTTGFADRIVKPDASAPGVLDTLTRFVIWRAAEQMWQDNFWCGVGPAHFDYRFREYRPELIQERPNRAHNDYINLLADWGTIGGLIVFAGMGIFIFALAKTWPHVRRAEDAFRSGQSNRFAFFIGATGGLLALTVHSTCDFNLHIPANALVGVTLLALLASNLRFATAQHWFRVGPPTKWALTTVLVAVIGIFTVVEWRGGGETLWLARAERLEPYSPARAVLLEKAFICEPKNFQTAFDIGECFNKQSIYSEQDADARSAINWYARAIQLNRYDGYSYLNTGMCLDRLGDHVKAEPYYSQAETLDPQGFYMIAHIGWHFVQIRDYAAARQYFLRSIRLDYKNNDYAHTYLNICETKLAEGASDHPKLPFDY